MVSRGSAVFATSLFSALEVSLLLLTQRTQRYQFFSNMYFFDHQCLCLFVLFSCLFVLIFYNSLAFKMGLVHFLSWLSFHRSRWPLLKIFLLLETLQQLKASCQLQQIVRLRWTFYKHPELTAEHQSFLFFSLNKPCKFFFSDQVANSYRKYQQGFSYSPLPDMKMRNLKVFYTANLLPKRLFHWKS